MRSTKYLTLPAYFIGGLLIVLPTLDFVLSVAPFRVHAVAWRFGAGGIFTRALLTPFVGLLVWFVTAWFLEHRAMLRVIAVMCWAITAVLVVAAVTFVLDSLQMRAQVNPQATIAFAFTVVVALAKVAAFVLAALILGRSSWKSAGRLSKERDPGQGLLVTDPGLRRGPTPTPS
jgi:hypothetical protein